MVRINLTSPPCPTAVPALDWSDPVRDGLSAVETRLRELEATWMQREGEQRELTQEMRAVQAELDEAKRILTGIEVRLAALREADEEQ